MQQDMKTTANEHETVSIYLKTVNSFRQARRMYPVNPVNPVQKFFFWLRPFVLVQRELDKRF